VHFITLTQLAVLIPLFVVIDGAAGRGAAVSFGAGAAVAVLPQAWFGVVLFGLIRRRPLQHTTRVAYLAHGGRFLLSAAGFALVFALLRPISGLAVIAGFAVMWALHVAGAAVMLRKRS
jgi:ATP synthase protein I